MKPFHPLSRKLTENGRSGEIRTPDPLLPKQLRYQAALHSDQFSAAFIHEQNLYGKKLYVILGTFFNVLTKKNYFTTPSLLKVG
jgi:hypothetical protein